jgi:hypothetical protein
MNPAARAGAALAGFASVGLSAAGLLDSLPEPARVAVALAGVIGAPALLLCGPLSAALHPARGLLSRVLPAAALATLAVHAVVAEAFLAAGARFSHYAAFSTWLLLALFAAALARVWRVRRGAGPRPRALAVVRTVGVVAALVAFAALVAPRYTGAEDAYDHMGYVRRVLTLDTMRPQALLAPPVPEATALPDDPRKGAFHDTVAFVANLAAADPVPVWSLLRLVMFPLAVLAFAGFARAFLRRRADFGACLVLFFLSYAGTAFQLVNAAAYGQSLAAIWYWVTAAVALGTGGAGRAARAWLALLAVGGVFVHLGVAVHLAVFVATLVLFAPALGKERREAAALSVWIGAGAVVALLVRLLVAGPPPPANEIHAHAQGVMTVGNGWFVMSPMEILRQHGLVFLGGLVLLPLTALAARRDRGARAALATSLIPVVIAFVPPVSTALFERASYMAFRTLLNAPLLPAAVLTAAWLVRGARARGVFARLVAAVVLAVWTVGFVGPSLRAFAADARRGAAWSPAADPTRLDTIVRGLPPGATILSDPVTSYRLSALTSHRFVAILQQHANPGDPDALLRLRAVRDALSPYVLPQEAVAACRRFDVDFLVLSGRPWEIATRYLTPGRPELYPAALARLRSLPDSFREFARGEDFVVFHFDPLGTARNDWSGVTAPVTVAPGPPPACAVPVPRDLFVLTGFSAHPATVAPGDSLALEFGYRRDVVASGAAGFGHEVVFHVRFDHVGAVPPGRRYPGDKHVRRARERLSGEVFRFRFDAPAGHGVLEPDLWPVGPALRERFVTRVPANAAPGEYRIEVKAVEESLLPLFDLSDLLYNRDHYAGDVCGALRVGEREAAP